VSNAADSKYDEGTQGEAGLTRQQQYGDAQQQMALQMAGAGGELLAGLYMTMDVSQLGYPVTVEQATAMVRGAWWGKLCLPLHVLQSLAQRPAKP
jgi:hypothetical protein